MFPRFSGWTLVLAMLAASPSAASEAMSMAADPTRTHDETSADPTGQAASTNPAESVVAQSVQAPTVPDQPAAAPVPAGSDLAAGTELVIASAYVWRGFVPTDVVSYQPTSWARYRNVTVSSWFNVAGGQSVGPLTEHDFTVDWSLTRREWTVSAGWINYVFPGAAADQVSNEVYGGVGYAGPLNPSVKVFQDVHAGSGTYVNLGVSQTFELPHGSSLTPAFNVGYNHEQWVDDSTWSDATWSAKLTVPTPVPRLWLSGTLAFTKGLNEAIFQDTFWGGVSIAVK
jgi:hypothetical protein